MTHAGLPVAGYQPQSDLKAAQVNGHKVLEEQILQVLDTHAHDPDVDQRWLAIGRTHIEQGFMAANRAIFRPTRVRLPEDDAK